MGFFDFFKKKTAEDYYTSPITFTLHGVQRAFLPECKPGDHVNLWASPTYNNVNIYAAQSIGGDGLLGVVPAKYSNILKEHLLSYTWGDGAFLKNYEASIKFISGSSCTIEVQILSPGEHQRRINKLIEDQRGKVRVELEKKYTMKKPVEIIFKHINKTSNTGNIKLKILPKDVYLQNPYDISIQLVDGEKIIAESISQRDQVFRVMKAYYNNQNPFVSKVKIDKSPGYSYTRVIGTITTDQIINSSK